ncbi:LuxR C-terminal-related transcriptional regulator [Streptomyces sp. N35]|uniref:ATP-binding protein n=1 Tax=Streptomyces sp. N35 TaxID=2795730 RepID=UPI0018F4ABC5|nr:LuxR C-terminal-related transcriptional regulator [Streptomyces sp. N35]
MVDVLWNCQRGELPSESTSFIGREREIEGVRTLFGSARLVTLLGPGGVGKTRIAVRAAASLADRFRDGVRMVELAGVKDSELVPHAVGAAFGLPESAGRSPLDAVVEFLREEQSLLVLDTCEHLVDSCAMLAEILLSSCPGLSLLLTSRQTLDVPAEHTVSVAPLELTDSVRLFTERAAAARPGFSLTPENEEQVTALCRRLDGIPLALELAAVRLRALPLEQVLRRLEDRFRALGGGRSPHPRHQTLRTAIDWSHDLCTLEERTLWSRLSVFAGGFDLAAAEQVCADAELDVYDIVDHLIGLVDKSIVIRDEDEGDDRYRMLDTIREYGVERLDESGARQSVVRCHRDHYLRLAREGNAAWFGAEQVAWTHRFDRDIDNFRTAMEWSLTTPGEAPGAVALCGALAGLWIGRGRVVEGLHWSNRAHATGGGDPADRGPLGFLQAMCLALVGELEEAADRFAKAAADYREAGDGHGCTLSMVYLSGVHLRLGQVEDSQRVDDEVAVVARELGDAHIIAVHHRNAGDRLLVLGDLAAAEQELLSALDAFPVGEAWATSITRFFLTVVRIVTGDLPGALEDARQTLRDLSRLPDLTGIANALPALAWIATAQGRCADAAVLAGSSAGIRRGVVPLLTNDPALLAMDAKFRALAEQALGKSEFDRLYAEGELLGLRPAVAFALGEPVAKQSDSDALQAPTLAALTRREREVAALVHQGMSNREIAERLVISKRTADAHVEHILAKLGMASRGEIAALVRAEHDRSRI